MEYDLDTLRFTERRLAALVVIDPVYLPLFVAIQKEIERLTETKDALAKAQAIAKSYKAVA